MRTPSTTLTHAKSANAMASRTASLLVKQPLSWANLAHGEAPDGGESVEQLQHRSEEAIKAIAASAAAGDSILVVSHGGTLGSLRPYFQCRLPGGLSNCSISAIKYRLADNTWEALSWGSTSHLEDVSSLGEVDRA